ncbi:hypothetical protein KKI24_23775 [bacterium]|nr:hypothetical protein [bacterium]
MSNVYPFHNIEKMSDLQKEAATALGKYNEGLAEQPDKSGPDFKDMFSGVRILVSATDKSPENVFFAQVIKNKAIRMFGWYQRSRFDRVFEIGDRAEYDSYNLSYIGPILSITEKTVSIDKGNGVKRLKLKDFIWRNHNFSLAETKRLNSLEMNYI